MTRYTRFSDIPQMTRTPGYRVNVSWDYMEKWFTQQSDSDYGVELVPDFQRGHVWTEAQQIAYIEFRLRGGESGREIMWNHPGWMKSFKGKLVLVDGLQRITAARRFMGGEIPAYGSLINEYTERFNMMRHDFIFYVNDLPTRADVLRWYLEINSGGTPHSAEEIKRVQALLDSEK